MNMYSLTQRLNSAQSALKASPKQYQVKSDPAVKMEMSTALSKLKGYRADVLSARSSVSTDWNVRFLDTQGQIASIRREFLPNTMVRELNSSSNAKVLLVTSFSRLLLDVSEGNLSREYFGQALLYLPMARRFLFNKDYIMRRVWCEPKHYDQVMEVIAAADRQLRVCFARESSVADLNSWLISKGYRGFSCAKLAEVFTEDHPQLEVIV